MQTLLGFTATDAGFALMPRVLVMMVAMPIVGRIYNAVSPRIVIAVGVFFIAWGAYGMSHFTPQTSQAGIILALTTQGVGFSCLFVPLSTVALSAIPRHKMADATGLNSLFRQVGGSIGLAIARDPAHPLRGAGADRPRRRTSPTSSGATLDRLRQTAGGLHGARLSTRRPRATSRCAPSTGRSPCSRSSSRSSACSSSRASPSCSSCRCSIFLKTPEQTAASASKAAAKSEPVHIEM